MAADTVANLLCNGKTPSKISTAATTIQWFPYVPGSSIGATSGGGAITPSGAGFVAGFLPVPGSSRANGQYLTLKAAGNVAFLSDASSPTITITLGALNGVKIQAAKLTDIQTIMSVANSTAGEFSNAGTSFRLTVDMNADSQSGMLQGTYSLQVDDLAASTGQLTALTGVNMDADQPLAFALGVTFSVAGAPNTANLYQFDLRQ